MTVTAVPAPLVQPRPAVRERLESIDLLRGIVMVIMVLDHTRDFVHGPALHYDPTDLAHTSAAIFMTRWITHFCAPVFVFLAGVSVYLQRMRGRTASDLSWFLVTRGVWLIVLECTWIRLTTFFNLDYGTFVSYLQVMWALGWCMVVLAALIHLPRPAIAVFSAAVIVLHNLLDGVVVQPWHGPASPATPLVAQAWMVVHQPGMIQLWASGPLLMLQYPLLPWIGLMPAGYLFGAIYELDRDRRVRLMRNAGAILMGAFVVIRAINVYGDPAPWAVQSMPLFTVLSFINAAKYPASLLYLLMTLGPALLALAWFETLPPMSWTRPLITFGRVPLFFYLLQWPLAHLSAIAANIIAGRSFAYLFMSPPAFFNQPWGVGFPLWTVYVCWACVTAVEYPACRWFAGVKQRRRDAWLSYF